MQNNEKPQTNPEIKELNNFKNYFQSDNYLTNGKMAFGNKIENNRYFDQFLCLTLDPIIYKFVFIHSASINQYSYFQGIRESKLAYGENKVLRI